MKAAVAIGFGDIDKNVEIREDWLRPTLPTKGSEKSKKKHERKMIIKVQACALAPGDVRVLSGKTDYMQLPESGHPYVIGSDVAGVVVETEPEETYFQVGDRVVSRFDEPKPNGGCAEFRLVKCSLSEKTPKTLSPVQACGLPASAMAAKVVARNYVKPGDRVLLLGASGGVGTFLCQYVKLQGASYLAATTTQEKLAKSLGCDRVIDYRQENWWEVAEFQGDVNKFDVVLDLVNGENWQRGALSGKALKRKAPYVQLLSGVQTEIEVHGPLDVIPLMFQMVGRLLYSRLHPTSPVWHTPEALKLEPGDLSEMFEDMDKKRIRVILDPASPFSFTEEGVRRAMMLQKSTHAHGKVVIKIAD